MKNFLNFLDNRKIQDLKETKEIDIKAFIDSIEKTMKCVTLSKYQNAVKKFLIYQDIENNTNICSEQIKEKYLTTDRKKYKAEKKNGRRDAIPDEYFNKLIQVLIKTMNDTDEVEEHRNYAAILLFDSQTGLRASELSLLEADSVKNIKIDDMDYRMIEYKIIKTAKNSVGYVTAYTYINDLAFMAYEFLMNSMKKYRDKRNNTLLFCPKRGRLPIDQNLYVLNLKYICIKFVDELDGSNKKYKNILSGETTPEKYIKKAKTNNLVPILKEKYKGKEDTIERQIV